MVNGTMAQTAGDLAVYGPLILEQLQEIKAALPKGVAWIPFFSSLIGVLLGGGITLYANKYAHKREVEREEQKAARERLDRAMMEARNACLDFADASITMQQKLMSAEFSRTGEEQLMMRKQVGEVGFGLQLLYLRLLATCPQEIIDCARDIQSAWEPVLAGKRKMQDPQSQPKIANAQAAFSVVIQMYFKDYLAKQLRPFPSTA